MNKLSKILLIALAITCQNPIVSMQGWKQALQEALYSITPASANPLTWFGNNFHAVENKRAYRSKTMSPKDLEAIIKTYKIKTILNLRESNGVWFDKEKEVAIRHGVQLHTITLDSEQLPTQQQLKEIFALFKDAPKPILFHCQAGVDRTSLVAAFWKLMMQNAPLQEALSQMTPSYGHFEWSRPLMRKCIELLDATRNSENKIILDNYNPEEAIKTISLWPMPVRAAKSLTITAKKHPMKTMGIFALAATSATALYKLFRK